jgi:transposase
MLHAGLDLSRNRLDVCLISDDGEIVEEFKALADIDGLAGLVRHVERRREPVRAVIESMTGARFVHDTLERLGWDVLIADAQKAKGLAPLTCKTDKTDARVLAVLSERRLVPEIWLPDPSIRAERELARFRLHLVKHRSALKNRIHSTLISFGKPCPVTDLFGIAGRELLQKLDLPEPWRQSVDASLHMIDELDLQIAELGKSLRQAGADHRYAPLLLTVPGIGSVLAYTIAAEIGDIERFASPNKLTGYTGLCPRVIQSGAKARSHGGRSGRHREAHARSALCWRQPDAPAVTLNDGPRDCEAQARAIAASRIIAAADERLEDTLALRGRDALTRVRDLDFNRADCALGADRHAAIGRRVAQRVLDEVEQDALKALRVRACDRRVRGQLGHDVDAARPGLRLHRLDGLADKLRDLDLLDRPFDLAGLEPGELEEVVDHRRQRADVGLHLCEVAGPFLALDDLVVDGLRQEPQRCQRRAEVVRHGRDEVAPRLVRGRSALLLGAEELDHRLDVGGERRDLVATARRDHHLALAGADRGQRRTH